MLDVWRMKKTKQIVHPVGAGPKGGYTYVLFPYNKKTKKGNRAALRIVKDENLLRDRENG
jgi:hypothetical protein